ncbi:hypothetical protein QBC42DRAFT_284407 [Cladorrhinum samala]|uniref:C2H2-type domain-containing protein n=1 Tax=Cladorrhinum samala TaxID=585594 RepID=A0AAV9HXK2_9PEZI|nr:hypothetical protein QBC42DRAFT_284407 [Cladorrhinum samala]
MEPADSYQPAPSDDPTQQPVFTYSDTQSDESDSNGPETPTATSPEPETVQVKHYKRVVDGRVFYFCQTAGCKTPEKPFRQFCQLTRHQRSHSLPVPCKYCPKQCAQQKDLARHMMKYHCNLDNPEVLNDPRVRKQFTRCHVCGQKGRYDNIKRHIRKKHKEASSSPQNRAEVGRSF